MKKILSLLLSVLLVTGLALPSHAAPFAQLDRAAAKQLLDPTKHQQPTIVALWSSDCSHCKKNLQVLSSALRHNKQLRVIMVAVEPETSVLGPILDRNQISGPRYAYGSDNPDAIAYAIDPAWAGELPRTYLFNGKGGKEGVSGVLTTQVMDKALGGSSQR